MNDMARQFNVKDFGAQGNGSASDTAAIQAAIDAAAHAGGGEVYLPAGIYKVSGGAHPADGALMIKSNVFIKGDGMGETVIKLASGSHQAVTGIIRSASGEATHDFGVSGLTIDGNRAHTTGKVDGWYNGFLPGEPGQNTRVTLSEVEIQNCSGYGFDPHERTANMLIENSVAHGNGLDGFVADYLIDSVFRNNLAYDNDRHGFNVVTSTHDLALLNNVAHHNGGAGVMVQRGHENIPSPNHITVSGGESYANGKEGVMVRLASGVDISGMDIHHNGGSGVRLHGGTNVAVRDNLIHENAQHGPAPDVQLQPYDDHHGSSGRMHLADHNIIAGNVIAGGGNSTYGVGERHGAQGHNSVYDNTFTHLGLGTTLLQGSGDHVGHNSLLAMLSGSAGHDRLQGTGDANALDGKAGADTLLGGAGDDLLWGGLGRDHLAGGSQDDTLIGGQGGDVLTGGAGNDVFRFTTLQDSYRTATVSHADRLQDFNADQDRIDLSSLGFTGLGDGHGTTLKVTTNAEHTRTYVKQLDQDLLGHRFELTLDGNLSGQLTDKAFVFADPQPALELLGTLASHADATLA